MSPRCGAGIGRAPPISERKHVLPTISTGPANDSFIRVAGSTM